VSKSTKHDGGQPISKLKNPGCLNDGKAQPGPKHTENGNPVVGGTSIQGGKSPRLIQQDNQKVPPALLPLFKLNFN